MRDLLLAALVSALVVTLAVTVILAATSRNENESRPQIGKAVCVKTTVRPDGSVHTETCIP